MDLINSLVPATGNIAWTIVFFVVALSIIVTIHEYGHYIVGRWCGIAAEVFSLGLGPVIWSRTDRRGTQWQIAAFPVGGYVKFLGDSGAASGRDAEALAEMDEATRRMTVHAAPLWARAATVAAGPGFNFILSIIIFTGLILYQGQAKFPITIKDLTPLPEAQADGLRPGDVIQAIDGHTVTDPVAWQAFRETMPDTATLSYTVTRDGQQTTVEAPSLAPAVVGSVSPASAASDVGIEPGDVVLSVDGQPVSTFEGLRKLAGGSNGKPMLLKIWRAGQDLTFTLVPRRMDIPLPGGQFETRWAIGVTNDMLFTTQTEVPGFFSAVGAAAGQIWEIALTSVSGLYHIAVGAISSCGLQGPIGIAKASGAAASAGPVSFITLIAVLSAAIGLLNLFPIPILDGGHLVLHAWEAVTGRIPGDRALKAMMSVGLVLLLGLMVYALSNDIRC